MNLSPYLCLTGACLLIACQSGDINKDNNDFMAKEVRNSETARQRVTEITELEKVAKLTSAKQTNFTREGLPFTGEERASVAGWQLEFDSVDLKLKSGAPTFPDSFPDQRKFQVSINSMGQLLCVRSKYSGTDKDMRPAPSAAVTRERLLKDREKYLGLPSVAPKISFLEALDKILSKGVGSPFQAKEIDAVYVLRSKNDSAPKAVWVISLRGLPPFPVRGPAGASERDLAVPIWQRNHIRNIIDANTGEFIYASNTPQPE